MAKELKETGLTRVDKTDQQLKGLFRHKKLTRKHTEKLSDKSLRRLGELTQERMQKLMGTNELDAFIEKVQGTWSQDTKNSMWEYNHELISLAITSTMQESNHLPSVQNISDKTKLSRQTIYKHLAEFSQHPLYVEQMLKMKMLASGVLARVYRSAIQGDTGASKLFLNACGMLNNQGTNIKHQQNYIQINGLTLTQDAIQMLSPDQLQTIENVLKQVAQPQAITQGNTINK